jgi:hypothetical protein
MAQSVQEEATAKFLFPSKARGISLFHSVHTSSGVPPSLISIGITPPGREADHSPLSSDEVKNAGAIPSLHHMPLWCVTQGPLYILPIFNSSDVSHYIFFPLSWG